jgi:undecaprenyl-phosphate 4-deoxy-4-formamido-L-arabinose transferase
VLVPIVLFSGVQLVMLGLLGEYLGRLFLTENQTPQFVVRG